MNQVLTLILFYTVVYNTALALLFITISQISNNYLTTTFSFYVIPQTTLLNKNLLITFFSMAGVPPFVGFFAKLSIFILLTNSYFYLFFILFFILLFSGLYFYMQNLRLILASSTKTLTNPLYSQDLNVRYVPALFILNYVLLTLLIFGFMNLEDAYLYLSWIIS